MSDFLSDAHAIWQYVTIAGVAVALILSFQSVMSSAALTVYRVTAVLVDIQVTLGLLLWLTSSGWSLGFMQGWLHPILGMAAVGSIHAVVSQARRLEPAEANRRVRLGLIAVVVLVVAAIGVAEMA